MTIQRKVKLAGKAILARLGGLSVGPIGASWKPPVDEQDKARRLLVFLSDRRALFEPFNVETDILVTNSVLEIRKRLIADLEAVNRKSQLGQSLAALAAACRKFLGDTRFVEGPREFRRHHHFGGDPEFFRSLGELRSFFGIHIAVLALVYGLEVEGELLTILPPESEAKSGKGETAS